MGQDTRIISRDGTYYVRAEDLKPGDLLDLEGDKYADPNGDGTHDDGCGGLHYEALEYELAEVLSVEVEVTGLTVILVETSLGTYGFPPEHEVNISLAANRDGTHEGP